MIAALASIESAIDILRALGLPEGQRNDRSALCLLALLDLRPGRSWPEASNPLLGITPIMKWVAEHFSRAYAPNSREAFRRRSIHQFIEAGLVLPNPDVPSRPVNSPKTVYQVEPSTLALVREFGSPTWPSALAEYLSGRQALVAKYASDRRNKRVPVRVPSGQQISLSPGSHSKLVRAVIEEFGPRFAPGSRLVYAGDTGDKWAFFDRGALEDLGVVVDAAGKIPDVILHLPEKNWLILVEAVTSHGPMDGKRHAELASLFAKSTAGLVFVTAFPSRKRLGRHLGEIAWETEVWVADAPSHLIHFDGDRFLGPYSDSG